MDKVYLDEMIPGFRDPEKRNEPIQPNEPVELIDNTSSGTHADSVQTKNENPIRFQFPTEILDKMRECREYIYALKAENERLKKENGRLKKENISLQATSKSHN